MLKRAENPVVTDCFVGDPAWRVPSLWRSEFRQTKEHVIEAHQVLELAIRTGCSTYVSEFVVLARQLECSLLTFYRKLLQLFPDMAIRPG
jgi:hypothetical protein